MAFIAELGDEMFGELSKGTATEAVDDLQKP